VKETIVSFEPNFIGFLRKIVSKVHINDILFQITHIVHVQNIRVFLAALLGATLPLTGYYLWIKRLYGKRKGKK
jgi:hypothetical protein